MPDTGNILSRNLGHSRAAYLFAIRGLPDPSGLATGPIQVNGFTFKTRSHIESMLIELGWSFFCRYEGCLEAYLKQRNVKLSKKKSLRTWLEEHRVDIPKELSGGFDCYRRIRNQLHHADGTSLDGSSSTEIHLMPEHMENFYNLFIWCGDQIERIIGQQAPSPHSSPEAGSEFGEA